MISRTTVAMLRAALYQYVDPDDVNSPLFLPRLNEVRSEFIDGGLWKGCVRDCAYQTDTNGQITLAPEHQSLLALTVHRRPTPIFTEFHRYIDVGPGLVHKENQSGWPAYDIGDDFCTVVDIPAGSSGKLRTTLAATADAGKVNRYFGLDQNGNEIFDSSGNRGENVTMVFPFNDTVNIFSKLTGVQKQASAGRQTVGWIDGSTVTTLNVYEPYETMPLYHRYQIGTVTADTRYPEQTISCKVRLRYIPVYAETDFVIPDVTRAYKFGLLALLNEASPNDETRGTAERFLANAYAALDRQVGANEGGARHVLNWNRRPSRNSF
jgi:hypothetical protein